MKPEIANMLVLSTGHVAEDDYEKFSIFNNVIHYDLEDTGWLVWVTSEKHMEPHFSKLSKGFQESYKLAQESNCEYIMFHRDGTVMDNLTIYDW